MKTIMRFLFILLLFFSTHCIAADNILPGAARLSLYLPLLKGKRVAVLANQGSLIGKKDLVTVLLQHHIHIVKIFSPEHGFSINQDTQIKNSINVKNKIPVISLYGKKLTPAASDLLDVDVIVFDIQDVGVRFYTYISTLQKLMEAAVRYNKPLIILDRPNPNGFYVDGPVLDFKYKSFTGMQPIPIVYGMTEGEYAKMLQGEQWLNVTPRSLAQSLQLTVIPCLHYTHHSYYVPPVKPSPNLPNIQSIYWYPSIGLMEATAMSVGRGTAKPFQTFGHPSLKKMHLAFSFVPQASAITLSPIYHGKRCYGWNLTGTTHETLQKIAGKLQIRYLIKAYRLFPDKDHFFKGFEYAAGNIQLEKQIKAGMSEKQIRASWASKLNQFKKIRQKYLLYA
ncbi:MAG: DUF1343 domain-containing protein [Gammaproteobacteria bacterium]|nr:DUF1343 domain-containing protein [Gammaproteobacteria bacterium]